MYTASNLLTKYGDICQDITKLNVRNNSNKVLTEKSGEILKYIREILFINFF